MYTHKMSVVVVLRWMRLSETAIAPTLSVEKGLTVVDLYAAEGAVIKSERQEKIYTDIRVGIPEGYYGRVSLRSGAPLHQGIHVRSTHLSAGWGENVGVVLVNMNKKKEFRVERGTRIARLVINKIVALEIEEVGQDEDDPLNITPRASPTNVMFASEGAGCSNR